MPRGGAILSLRCCSTGSGAGSHSPSSRCSSLLCLLLAGFAGACASDQPGQALERALAGLVALAPVAAAWSLLAAVAVASSLVVIGRGRVVANRASPVLLGRFLF